MSVFEFGPVRRLRAGYRAFRRPTLVLQASSQHYRSEPSALLSEQLLSGKSALVTGVGENIGKSIAIELAANGASVYCTCLEEEQCRVFEKELGEAFRGKVQWLHSDLTSESSNDALFAQLREKGIRIDIYVNNAVSHSADMEEAFQANLFSPLRVARRIAQGMINDGVAGSLLFLTSIHQERIRRIMSYSSSKAALGMAIEELAFELAPYNIRVNGIAPGYVAEDGIGEPLPHRATPLAGTSITPRYIGRAAVYLSSDYFSRYTTGAILRIDGGLSLFNHLCLDILRDRDSTKPKPLFD